MSGERSRLVIVGASGHGKVVADVAQLVGYEDIVFLDADPSVTSCASNPVIGSDALVSDVDGDLFIAIGNPAVRRRIMEACPNRTFPVLVHPRATVAKNVTLGSGSVVMAGAVVNPGARIGKGAIVNTCASIDHDCVVGDFCHIAVGAHLCGSVSLGDGAWVGAGATVSNDVDVCAGVMLGAGAVVVRNIAYEGTYVGVPARRIQNSGISSMVSPDGL